MKQKGLTTVELLVTSFVVGIIALMAGGLLTYGSRSGGSIFGQQNLVAELSEAVENVLRVGRLAQSCSYSAPHLICIVDFHMPPTLDDTDNITVRFYQDNDANEGHVLKYEHMEAGSWVVKRVFHGVTSFDVCDDASMQDPASCSLLPAKMTQQHEANLAATPQGIFATLPDRFYRFRLVSTDKEMANYPVQSAFYVRNPTLFTEVVYRWGTMGDN